MPRVLLLRHTEVVHVFRGRCYGQTNVALSAAGRAAAHDVSGHEDLAEFKLVVASPLRRARFLGALVARRTGAGFEIEPRLAERNHGTWEGQTWDDIWRAEGDAMNGLIHAPDTFQPGGGETTAEVARRALAWLELLPDDAHVAAVCHAGPIVGIVGQLLGASVPDWLDLVPRFGTGYVIERGRGHGTLSTWPEGRELHRGVMIGRIS